MLASALRYTNLERVVGYCAASRLMSRTAAADNLAEVAGSGAAASSTREQSGRVGSPPMSGCIRIRGMQSRAQPGLQLSSQTSHLHATESVGSEVSA
eukprot:3121022-Pleurochrysis_carterae.AAC.1